MQPSKTASAFLHVEMNQRVLLNFGLRQQLKLEQHFFSSDKFYFLNNT